MRTARMHPNTSAALRAFVVASIRKEMAPVVSEMERRREARAAELTELG